MTKDIFKENGVRITPRLLKVPEAAHYLSLSREMVYQMVQQEQLPVTRCGRAIRLDIKALDKWIERNTTGGNNF